MSAMISAVVRRAFRGSVVSGCRSGCGCGCVFEVDHADEWDVVFSEVFLVRIHSDVKLFVFLVL